MIKNYLIILGVSTGIACATPCARAGEVADSAPAKPKRIDCSIDELKKLIVPVQAMYPPASPDEVFNYNRPPSEDPYHDQWNIWDGEFDTPNSITVRLISRNGELTIRTAFLDQNNYVMSETLFDYPDNIYVLLRQKRSITVSPGRATHLYFCDDKVQLPAGSSADEVKKWTKIGQEQRSWFFDKALPITGLDLKKIPAGKSR